MLYEVITGVPVDQLRDPEFPLWKRVAVQLEALRAIAEAYGAAFPEGEVRYDGVPGYAELEARGLEAVITSYSIHYTKLYER